MMFVLDTNVVSELRKVRIGKADANVTAWTETVDAADLFVSAITIMDARGWSSMYCQSSLVAHCLSILPWRCAAPGYMCLISAESAMHSLRQRPLCMA